MMITLVQCVAWTGIYSDEMILGVSPSLRHRALLGGYLLNLERGAATVRDMIVFDYRSVLELGARERAADLLVVLRIFLFEYPQARRVAKREAGEPAFLELLTMQTRLPQQPAHSVSGGPITLPKTFDPLTEFPAT
jgi:hypothetical protein